jgi:hypothetical protein
MGHRIFQIHWNRRYLIRPTARFIPKKRTHNNWQDIWEEIIVDFTPTAMAMAQGQLAAALAEVTHLKAEKVGPVSSWRCGDHQWRFEWRNQLEVKILTWQCLITRAWENYENP